MKKAIILCSGGLDSVVSAYYAKKILKYRRLIFLFFDYNQNSLAGEMKASKKFADRLNADFIKIKINFNDNSNLTSHNKFKKIKIKDLKNTKLESEKFYIPNRNGVFLSYSILFAEKINADIVVGFNSEGSESYPDATKEFVEQMNKIIGIMNIKHKIISPFINKDKDEIVKLGVNLGVKLDDTISCYVSNVHCGTCLACRLRQEAFYWANIKDYTRYRVKMIDYR